MLDFQLVYQKSSERQITPLICLDFRKRIDYFKRDVPPFLLSLSFFYENRISSSLMSIDMILRTRLDNWLQQLKTYFCRAEHLFNLHIVNAAAVNSICYCNKLRPSRHFLSLSLYNLTFAHFFNYNERLNFLRLITFLLRAPMMTTGNLTDGSDAR